MKYTEIIAIDPGPKQSGIVRLRTIDGVPFVAGVFDNVAIANSIMTTLRKETTILAIERISAMGMSVAQVVFDSAFTGGYFAGCWVQNGQMAEMIFRREVKLHLLGRVNGNDAQVRAAIIARYGPNAIGTKKNPGPLYGVKSHAWAALAVACVALDWMKNGAIK